MNKLRYIPHFKEVIMIVNKYTEIEKNPVDSPGAEKVSIRWLIAKGSGAPGFYMRHFEVEPGGHTPYHNHANEHEIYVLEGVGRIRTEMGAVPISAGTFALIVAGEMHCFENIGSSLLKFLCMIPKED